MVGSIDLLMQIRTSNKKEKQLKDKKKTSRWFYSNFQPLADTVSWVLCCTELMKKLTYLIDGETILKYQVVSEDLDALVSVKSDEDLRHMCDEIERYENAGGPRLRAFLFPAKPVVMENQISCVDHHALEQRYIDAINGIIRPAPNPIKQHPNINAVQTGSLVSSGCSSPRSPDSCTTDTMNNETVSNYYNSRLNMHKVQSSPSICSLNSPGPQYIHQFSPHYVNHYPGYQSPKPPIDYQRSVGQQDRLISVRSIGRAEGARCQLDPPLPHYYPNSRVSRGNGCCTKCMHYDDSSHFSDRRMAERTSPLAMSPASSSPRLSHSGMRAWEATVGGDVWPNYYEGVGTSIEKLKRSCLGVCWHSWRCFHSQIIRFLILLRTKIHTHFTS